MTKQYTIGVDTAGVTPIPVDPSEEAIAMLDSFKEKRIAIRECAWKGASDA